MISAAAEQQRTLAQLEAGLESTAGASGQTMQSLRALSQEMQNLTVFSNETVEAAEGILLSFTNIADDVFPRTMMAAANVATRMGQDLNSTVVQLGKALNDPIANLGALSRSGIQFSIAQKTVIKELVNTNQLAKAQRLILNELDKQYAKSAVMAKDTLGGAISGLKNDFDDLVKSSSEWLGVADGMQEAATRLGSGFRQLAKTLSGTSEAIGGLPGPLRGRRPPGGITIGGKTYPYPEGLDEAFDPALGITGVVFGTGEKRRKDVVEEQLRWYDRLGQAENELQQQHLNASLALNTEQELLTSALSRQGELTDEIGETTKAYSFMADIAANAFADMILDGKTLHDVLGNLSGMIAHMMIQGFFQQAFAPSVATVLGGGGGYAHPSGSGFTGTGPLRSFGNAKGNVISSPSMFASPGVGIGTMAESGPEAIMPLRRGPDGRLGVEGGAAGIVVNNYMSVSAMDSQSFEGFLYRNQGVLRTMSGMSAERRVRT